MPSRLRRFKVSDMNNMATVRICEVGTTLQFNLGLDFLQEEVYETNCNNY
jgi:hypothetical protein